MSENTDESFEAELLYKAFRAGFLESAEGWNGEMYHGNPESYERRLRARFEALNESGKFDGPLEWGHPRGVDNDE